MSEYWAIKVYVFVKFHITNYNSTLYVGMGKVLACTLKKYRSALSLSVIVHF